MINISDMTKTHYDADETLSRIASHLKRINEYAGRVFHQTNLNNAEVRSSAEYQRDCKNIVDGCYLLEDLIKDFKQLVPIITTSSEAKKVKSN